MAEVVVKKGGYGSGRTWRVRGMGGRDRDKLQPVLHVREQGAEDKGS